MRGGTRVAAVAASIIRLDFDKRLVRLVANGSESDLRLVINDRDSIENCTPYLE